MKEKEHFKYDCLVGINKELLLRKSGSLFWVIDTNFRLLNFNKAAEDFLFDNYSMAISLGESILDLHFDLDFLKKWEFQYSKAFKGDTFIIQEAIIKTRSTKKQEQIITIKPLSDLKGVIVGAFCTVVDLNKKEVITFENNNPQELIAQLNDYEESVMVLEIKNENNYEVKFVNNQFLKLTRIEDGIEGKNLKEFIKVHDLPNVVKKYNEAIESKGIVVWQELLSIGTKTQNVLIKFKPVTCKNNKCTHLVVSITKLFICEEDAVAFKHVKYVLMKALKFSNDIICTLDKNGTFILVSDATTKILGYYPQEISGTNFIDYVHPDDLSTTKSIPQIIEDGSTYISENRYLHKNGSSVNMLWSTHWDDDEKLLYCIARDVSEYKKIIKKTEETENHLNEAQRFSNMGSWNYDLTKDILTWSDPLYDVFGVSKLQFDQKHSTFLEFVVPEDKDFVSETSKQCQLAGDPFNITYRIITPEGQKRIIEEFGYSEKAADGTVLRIFGSAQDITTRRKTEKLLEKSTQKYKYLFQNNPLPLFIFDFETLQIIDANIEALLLYGYSREKFLKLTIRDIRPKEDIDLIVDATSSEECYGEIHKKNWRHQKKNGEIFFVDVTGHMIDYEDRRCSFVLITDVTEKLALERKEKEHIHFIETTLENLPIGIAVNTI